MTTILYKTHLPPLYLNKEEFFFRGNETQFIITTTVIIDDYVYCNLLSKLEVLLGYLVYETY